MRSRGFVNRVDAIVQKEDLPAAVELELDRALNERVVELGDVSADRQAIDRRRVDEADVAQAGESHVQSARYRRRGEREHVGVGFECFEFLFVLDAEAVLFVDDDEAQVIEAHVAREQAVGADDDVDLAFGKCGERGFLFFLRLEARDATRC